MTIVRTHTHRQQNEGRKHISFLPYVIDENTNIVWHIIYLSPAMYSEANSLDSMSSQFTQYNFCAATHACESLISQFIYPTLIGV